MKKIKTLLLLAFTFFFLPTFSSEADFILSKEFIYEKAPFIECHASSIESTKDGMIATWFGGTKESNKDVEIWVSHFKDNKWSDPISVANGIQHEGKRYPCWNPVLFQIPNGDLLLFYKVGPSPSKWWGMLKRSKDSGYTWTDAERLPEDILGPIKNRPFLTSDGRLICPSSTEVNSREGWRLHFEVSSDYGKTWMLTSAVEDTKDLNAIQPSILMHGDDNHLQAVARSMNGGVVSTWSCDGGRTWSEVQSTDLPNPNSGTDAITLREGLHMIVYNHSNRPSDKWSGPRTPLNIGISADGLTWHNIAELETEVGEYSYPAIVQAEDGKVHITYTWKRRKIRHVIVDPQLVLQKYPKIKDQIDQQKKESLSDTVIPVIFDTDMGNDIDDALALAMLYNYQKKGIIDLLGITINKANPNTKPFIDIMNHFYGVPKTPIGYIGNVGPTPEDGKYLLPVVQGKDAKGKRIFKRKIDENSKMEEAWKLQRKLLASQKDHSVVMISVGFSSNLEKLITSLPDQYSSLSGMELIRKKVKYLSVMAGNFADSSKAEYNVVKDIPAAQKVFDQWPTKVIFGGWEVGALVRYPATSIINDFKEPHPVRLGYESYKNMPYDRETWDLLSVLIVAEGYKDGLTLSDHGKVEVNDKGGVVFHKHINGLHQYLIFDESKRTELIQTLINAATGK